MGSGMVVATLPVSLEEPSSVLSLLSDLILEYLKPDTLLYIVDSEIPTVSAILSLDSTSVVFTKQHWVIHLNGRRQTKLSLQTRFTSTLERGEGSRDTKTPAIWMPQSLPCLLSVMSLTFFLLTTTGVSYSHLFSPQLQ